jgi:hypothetical protein
VGTPSLGDRFSFARDAAASARAALLLEEPLRLASSYPVGQRPSMRALVRLGRERLFAADVALEDGQAGSALTLYREAAALFARARLAVESPEQLPEGMVGAELVERFDALPLPRGPVARGASLAELLAPVSAPPAPADVVARAATARATVRWLASLVEPRGTAELRLLRRVRLAALGLTAAGLWLWAGAALLRSPNLALHKPVTASGIHASSISPPSGLTDGVIAGAPYGVHTSVSDAPWVQIDLLSARRISTVKVFNRADGWFDDCLPLTLQLSSDGVVFADVATRTKRFTQLEPWVVDLGRRHARYVRLRGPGGRYVALSEVEVYGR